jgi:hypothetical protein
MERGLTGRRESGLGPSRSRGGASRRRGRGGADEAQSERVTYTGSVRPDVWPISIIITWSYEIEDLSFLFFCDVSFFVVAETFWWRVSWGSAFIFGPKNAVATKWKRSNVLPLATIATKKTNQTTLIVQSQVNLAKRLQQIFKKYFLKNMKSKIPNPVSF